jgi:hypothetical protein
VLVATNHYLREQAAGLPRQVGEPFATQASGGVEGVLGAVAQRGPVSFLLPGR